MFLSAKSHHRQNTLVSVQLINQRESEVEPVRNARAALESKDKQLARHEMMRSVSHCPPRYKKSARACLGERFAIP